MTLYRKKPIEVQALRWSGSPEDYVEAYRLLGERDEQILTHTSLRGELWVKTVDGNEVKVPVGAYLVIDGKGYPYPCDAELFEANHDLVSEDGSTEWDHKL